MNVRQWGREGNAIATAIAGCSSRSATGSETEVDSHDAVEAVEVYVAGDKV